MGSPRALIERYRGRKKLLLKDLKDVVQRLDDAGIGYVRENSRVVVYFDSFREVARLFEILGDALEYAEPVVRSGGMEEVFLNLLGARITEEGVLA